MQTVKCGIKAFDKQRSKFDAYLSKLLLSYRSIPHAGRPGSPSALNGRQLRCPITAKFESDSRVWYQATASHQPVAARFVVQEGINTAVVVKEHDEVPVLAHLDQLRKIPQTIDEPPLIITESQTMMDPSVMEEKLTDGSEQPVEHGSLRRSSRRNHGVPPERYGEVYQRGGEVYCEVVNTSQIYRR